MLINQAVGKIVFYKSITLLLSIDLFNSGEKGHLKNTYQIILVYLLQTKK